MSLRQPHSRPFNSKLRSASIKVTDQILEYWTQNIDLEVQIRIDQGKSSDPAPYNNGQIARARIHNQLHRADTPFSERSAGFVWFFSFLVKFGLIERSDEKVVLLLDEPGLTLHGKAQGDLLRFFAEKLAPTHQLVYSTHSPFMVPHDNLLSCRVVEDKVIERVGKRRTPTGTKVSGEVLLHDKDTIFPLQGALGYEISQSLFVGKHILLVEGPSDILYLQALSNELRRRKRTGLDERWTICPSGGIDKISAFVSLFGGNGLDVAVLTDLAKGDKTKLENLRKSEILNAGRLYTAADFTGKTEADIEDLLEPELYCALLNASHAVPSDKSLTPAKLAEANPSTPRSMKQAEAIFRTIGDFSHYAPAYWLLTHPECLTAETTAILATLERAEKVFTTFNGLLPTK
jgi:predicted ATP-dependent endonuclease of OLD family